MEKKLVLLLCFFLTSLCIPYIYKPSYVTSSHIVPDFKNKSAKDGIVEALLYYDIQHPDIVYAQAILETGNFKSKQCLEHNNLFGLYNSRKQEYYKFEHWTQSIIFYRKYIQNRYYMMGYDDIHYYNFLQRIGYAEDPNYINKLKQIVKQNDTRRCSKRD